MGNSNSMRALICLSLAACDGEDQSDQDDLVEDSDTGEDSGTDDSSDGSTTFLDDGDDLIDVGDEGSTGDPTGCAINEDPESCYAEMGCVAIFGHAIVFESREWCTELEPEYIGCAEGGNLCPGFTKTVCGGDQAWQTDQCVPDNLSSCEGPGEVTGSCNAAVETI